jgi:hypothetical protein
MGKVVDLIVKSIEERQDDWIANYPDKFLACREQHDFPRMVPGKRLVRTRFEPWVDPEGERVGCYYQEQSCRNCGRIRWRITGPPGAFYLDATRWKYKDPSGYASPKGLGLTKADYLEELFRRVLTGDQDTVNALEEHGA